MPRNTDGVISLLSQLQCLCNPDYQKFSSLPNTDRKSLVAGFYCSRRSHLPRFPSLMLTWQNIQHSTTPLLVFRETHLGNDCRNSILMTCHCPNLGSSSDWLKQNRPIRSTTQIWVVTPHQCGISAVVSLTSFREETNGGVSKCRLFNS